MPGLGLSIPDVSARGRGLDPATTALMARMSVTPGVARARLIDAVVRSLKQAGVWAKLDLLYLLAAHDAQAARLNWLGASYTLAAVNSPGFVADRGYASDGATSYLDSGFNPATAGGRFALDDAGMGFAFALDAAGATASRAGNANARVGHGIGTALSTRANCTTTSGGAPSGTLRMVALSRSGAGGYDRYADGVAVDAPAVASTSVTSANFTLLGIPGVSFGTRQGQAFWCGQALGAGEQAAIRNAIAAYLAGVGA